MVASLKDEILRMAAGNLRDNVPEMGQDVIGIIAEEQSDADCQTKNTIWINKSHSMIKPHHYRCVSIFKLHRELICLLTFSTGKLITHIKKCTKCRII